MSTLLEAIQAVIERVYDRGWDAPPAGAFVIGDEGFRRIYRDFTIRPGVGPDIRSESSGARVLLRPQGEVLRLSIYYPDALIARLEAISPVEHLGDENIEEFLSFVEELDHYLLIAQKWHRSLEFSLLELELHANVTKHFVTRHLLRRQGALDARHELWLAYHLFHRSDFVHEIESVRARYQDARRLAFRYVTHLMELPTAARLRGLRAWSGAGPQEKVAAIEAIAA